MPSTPFSEIRHGARVVFTDARGATRTGRAVGLLIFPTHAVLNVGGKHGTPAVVYPEQVLAVRAPKGAAPSTRAGGTR
jgi:hypothetical protein